MRRSYIYILMTILLLVTVFGVTKSDTKSFKVDGIKYAVSVDGEKVSSFPAKGSYNVEVTCEGATAKWNYEDWLAELSAITGDVTCSLTFTSKTKTALNDYIKSLIPDGSTTVASTLYNDGSTLEIINSALDTGTTSTDYRYRGPNPNNYIKFNNELWRIIGVLDQYSHGQTGEQLVKIIRNNSIGGYVFDSDGANSASGYNNWPTSDIYNLLNTAYYTSINATGEEYCYSYAYNSNVLGGKCDFTVSGLKEPYKSMIKNVTWYLGGFNETVGGYSGASITSADMYKYERSTDSSSIYYYSGNATTKTDTPVGLMYVSDYGYAMMSSVSVGVGSYGSYTEGNWLKSNGFEWTITHSSDDSGYNFTIEEEGGISNYSFAGYNCATRPVVYLDSSVYYISGTGTITDPYIINM